VIALLEQNNSAVDGNIRENNKNTRHRFMNVGSNNESEFRNNLFYPVE
jgi:hypothetical protein